jgi:predicted ATP-binding protein involved in virulence
MSHLVGVIIIDSSFSDDIFVLSPRYKIVLINSDNKIIVTVNKVEIPSQFFSNQVISFSAIIGSNGSGKSRLIKIIQNSLRDKKASGEIKTVLFIENESQLQIIDDQGIISSVETELQYEVINDLSFPESIGLGSIYISPYFDNKDYEQNNTSHLNLSTDNLRHIENENRPSYDLNRSRNTIRYLKLLNDHKDFIAELNLPKEYEVHFWNRNWVKAEPSQDKRDFLKKIQISFEASITIKIQGNIQRAQILGDLDYFREYNLIVETNQLYLNLLTNLIWSITNYHGLKEIEDQYFEEGSNFIDQARKYLEYIDSTDIYSYSISELANEIYQFIRDKTITKLPDRWSAHYFRTFISIEDVPILIKIIEKLKVHFKIQFVEMSMRYISSGEKTYLDLFSRLKEGIEQIQHEYKFKDIILFLDECEIGMHPEWKRKYVFLIIEFLKYYDANFQIIVTSHSPFVLSDLPEGSVVPLVNHKGKISVAKGSIGRTFGANIHELLMDSFFMRNGLMGEFAQQRIKKLIDDNVENDSEMTKFILDQIGDNLLRTKLKEYYQ